MQGEFWRLETGMGGKGIDTLVCLLRLTVDCRLHGQMNRCVAHDII